MQPEASLLLLFALQCAVVRADQLVISYPQNSAVIYNSGNTSTTSATSTNSYAFSGTAAYNLTELPVPALSSTMPALSFGVQLYEGGMANLSIPLNGAFMGFSIEMSVSVQVSAYMLPPLVHYFPVRLTSSVGHNRY